MAAGLKDMKVILPYSVLLLRSGQYRKARELLVAVQKYPMADDQKRQLYVNYAVAVYKLGDLDKALEVLEVQQKKAESGLVYETLGYLLVEAGDFDKSLEYNLKALEYDDEDPITLDNLGQTYYRLKGDQGNGQGLFRQGIGTEARSAGYAVFPRPVRYRSRKSRSSPRKAGDRAGRAFLSPEFCQQRKGRRTFENAVRPFQQPGRIFPGCFLCRNGASAGRMFFGSIQSEIS